MGSAIDLTLRCSAQVPPSDGVVFPGGYHESLRKAKEYLQCLEDERRKVEGFKRELPISIKLLEDAIRACKEKLASARDVPTLQLSCSSMDSEKERCSVDPTLEEFLPSKRRWSAVQQSDGDNVEPERTKRPAWMTEGRLWNQSSTSTRACHEEKEKECVDPEQSCVTSSQLPFGSSKEKTSPGAFLPFLKEHPDAAAAAAPSLVSRPTPTMAHNGVGLSLSFGDLTTSPGSSAHIGLEAAGTSTDLEVQIQGFKDGTSCDGSSPGAKNSKRKARRCWAPELHRRFVSALHQLGGAEVATPKQICELMKVDGLTNDEVKSHLQKYRLHNRRPGSSPQLGARGAHSPQLVVLGGIWVPPKCPQAAPSAAAVYDSSTGHLSHLNFQAAPPQNHYFACISNGAAAVAAAAPVQMHRQPGFHEPLQAASQSQSSPQGSLQVTSQFSEATQGPNSEVYRDDDSGSEEEEAKSDSTSWQNESYSSGEKKIKKSSSEQCTSH